MIKSILHVIAGATAFLIIGSFWITTIISELFLEQSSIAFIKHAIVIYGLPLLLVTMATIGSTGAFLGKNSKSRIVAQKKRRMQCIALNGIFIMLPSALFLNFKASSGNFDFSFYFIQVVELLVGFFQLLLLFINFQDGLKLVTKQQAHSNNG